MPTSRQYKRQCEGKRAYATNERAAEEIRRAHKATTDVVAYFCPWCRLWHVGHRKRKR